MIEVRLDQARATLRAGQLDHAERLVKDILAADPSSVDGLNILGTVAIRRQRPADAIKAFSTAAGFDPTPKSSMNLGRALEMQRDPKAAVTVYQTVLERFPDHAAGRVALLHALFALGDLPAMVRAAGPEPETLPLGPEGLHRLALACCHCGKQAQGAALIDRSLAADPTFAPSGLFKAHLLLSERQFGRCRAVLRPLLAGDPANAEALRLLAEGATASRAPDAERWLRRAIAMADPPNPRLHLALGERLRLGSRYDEALPHYTLVLDRQPENWLALEGAIQCLLERKRHAEVEELARRTLNRRPANPAIWNNLAISLKTAERPEIAVAGLRQAMLLFPDNPTILYNAGSTLNDLTFAEEAERYLSRAVRLNPRYAKAWNALSVSYGIQYRAAEAEQACRNSLRVNGGQRSAWLNLGIAMRAQGRFAESIRAMRLSLAQDRSYAEAHQNLSYNLLMLGELEQGFTEYDWRWAVPGFPSSKRPFALPVWDGRPLGKDGLLIYMEQGMGDEVMFSWYLHRVMKDVRNITVECDERLIPLFERSFPSIRFFPRTAPADRRLFDPQLRYKVPAGHLPKFYWVDLREHMGRVGHLAGRRAVRTEPYLKVDPARAAYWRDYLRERAGGRPLIGVSWRSALRTRTRDVQYLAPEEISRAFGFDVALVNLQYSWQEDELATFKREGERHGFHFVHPDGIDLKNDLDDVMALISALDLVISPLISVAWMAGALGVPTWVFRTNEVSRIWQQFGTPHVPWTPSLRLFFRHPLAPWQPQLEMVRGELEAWCRER